MHAFAKDDYSWSRPNRRYLPKFYMPTLYSESLDHVCIAVDSSGSVSTREFTYFINELIAIKEYLNPTQMTLLDFDTEIKAIHKITKSTNIYKNIKFTGRGGTDIVPILEWATKEKPEILLIFTDGEFRIPDISPIKNVIWLIHNNPKFKINYGKIIHYEI
jgi:predicted metal-dependent peptidase